ncbi:hypothetical protein K4F52_003425 [Lecanicillium sp. MT-2017a]|nr:hypothetical protein K4F52_003425 [Lecanicillium sp. MT-2017a]
MPVLPRQNNNDDIIIPTTYSALSSSPNPGIVAGIVLGSVGGFLLILALLYSCLGWAPITLPRGAVSDDLSMRSRSVLSFRTRTTSHNKHHHHSHGSHRKTRPVRATEMFEVRTTERTSTSRPRQAVPPQSRGSVRVETVQPPPRVVRDDSSSDEDEVVVIEEHSPPPRRKSHRQSGGSRRGDERRSSRRYSRD